MAFWITKSQHSKLLKDAKKAKMSISDFIRMKALERVERESGMVGWGMVRTVFIRQSDGHFYGKDGKRMKDVPQTGRTFVRLTPKQPC